MKTNFLCGCISPALTALSIFLSSQCLIAAEAESGFKNLFNGKDLTGWDGRPQHWSVEDGAITGRTTKEHPAKGNNFLIWRGGTVDDFELRLSYKITANNDKGFANSGIQYRSREFKEAGDHVVGGYQADFEAGNTYSGILYEERMRGILAERGQKVVIKEVDGKTVKDVVGSVGNSADIQAAIKKDGWNDYVIIAKGNHLQHFINGKQTVDVVDEQESKAAKSGILALQLHAGDPMTVQFKDIRIKTLTGASSAKSDFDLLQGDWVAVELVANGEKVPAESLTSVKLKIKGNAYSVDTDQGQDAGTFKLVEGGNLKAMDVTTGSGDQLAAIYELSGDTFKSCYALNGGARPTDFKSTDGSDRVFAVYKRKSQ
ncbi:MAG: DUF1080 domain-containing protein [Verrucomicrobia bacterium]|nr:DUF1080 domain-containing protein [Verrucomicrobiota bacterium]